MPKRQRLVHLAQLVLASAAGPALAQSLPSMECGQVQSNLHIRCTAAGATPFDGAHRTAWSPVPSKVTLNQRHLDEAECHAAIETTCEQISRLPASYATAWTFEQRLGSTGCEAGATGNGWIDPYTAWRARVVLPRRGPDVGWLLTVVASTITTATIRSYPEPAVAISPCHLLLSGAGISLDVAIARGAPSGEQREAMLLQPGEYLAELRCPAIQGSACQSGKASVALQLTASPDER